MYTGETGHRSKPELQGVCGCALWYLYIEAHPPMVGSVGSSCGWLLKKMHLLAAHQSESYGS